jgi:hypothetical protein
MKSNKWMKLWQECQSISEVNKDINFFLKLKFFFKYGLYNFSIYSLEISQIITTFQAFYYETRENEILKELDDITAYLNNTSNHLLDNLTNDSMKFLKNYLANKYEKNTYRQLFTSEDFLKNPYDILNEYPKKKYDVVVSNPPYIEKAVIETLQTEVKDYEPRIALDGGEDGLVFYRRITETAHNFLKKGGLLAFEIGYNQGESIRGLMQNDFYDTEVIKDLNDNDRVVIGKLK